MSGHNKWSKIKHKKASTDAKKSKLFGKLARLIAVESRLSGGDTGAPGLRLAIEKARKENMPSDNIDRAITKGKTDTGSASESVIYETYGPGGVALIIEGLTDNGNRTSQEIKHLLAQNNCSLSAQGSALWAFEKKEGEWIAKTTVNLTEPEKEKLETLVQALNEHEDIHNITTNAT